MKRGRDVLVGVSLLGAMGAARGQTAGGAPVSAPTLGIDKNNTASRNRENLVESLSNSDVEIVFPPGDYFIDNSGSYVIINRFEGTLMMEPGARFVFTDNTMRGLNFQGGTGARLYNLSSTFETPPSSRIVPEECIIFLDSTDTVVWNANIDGSASVGLLFHKCIRPSVFGAVIRNTMADGLHFANCQDATADNIFTQDTGDDGLAFLNYGDLEDYSGGQATNITVKRSKARGIAVVGQRDVVIDGFTVDGTSISGLICAYDSSYQTRVPSNVQFANGVVTNGGAFEGDPDGSDHPGNRYGIDYEDVASVEFNNITVNSPKTRGVSGQAPNGTVVLSNIEVRDAPESGFDLRANTLHLDDLIARDTGNTGVYVGDSGLVSYGRLTSINVSKTDSLRRAFNFENNAWVGGTELHVVDDQDNPTGYKVVTSGDQSGRLGRIYDRVTKGNVQVENSSGLVLL